MRSVKTKVTKHGKRRLKERLNIFNAYAMEMKASKVNGKRIYNYEGKFFYYLNSKNNGEIRVYKENVFLFGRGRRSKKLITVFPVPKKFLPTKDYEIKEDILNKVLKINKLEGQIIEVLLYDDAKLYGRVLFDWHKPRNAIRLKLKNNRVKLIKGKYIRSFCLKR